jgi:hypothetical protein
MLYFSKSQGSFLNVQKFFPYFRQMFHIWSQDPEIRAELTRRSFSIGEEDQREARVFKLQKVKFFTKE